MKIFRPKYRRIYIGLLIFIILSTGFIITNFTGNSAQAKAQLLRSNPLLIKLLPIYRSVKKISDILYLPYYFKKSQVPTYELEINQKNIQKMNDSLPKAFMGVTYTNKTYVPAKFKYDGKEYDVKIRYRGDNAVHWNAPKKSYLIKFNKDHLFKGMRRISFIIPDDREFVNEHFSNYRASKLGLLHPPSSFANLKINGKNNGLYFQIENWSKEMLAKWEVPDESNFYSDKDLEAYVGVAGMELWKNPSSWKKIASDSRFNYDHASEIKELIDLINNPNDKEFNSSIFNLVDRENFYAWQVHQSLMGSTHQLTANMRMYFDNSAGKFYFVAWDVADQPVGDSVDIYNALSKRILNEPEYLLEKHKRLYSYVDDDKNIADDLEFYDQTYKLIKTDLFKDRMKIYTNRWAANYVKESRQEIENNFIKIKNILSREPRIFIETTLDPPLNKFNNKNILGYFDVKVSQLAEIYLNSITIKLNGGEFNDYTLYYDSNFNQQLDSQDKLIGDLNDILLFDNKKDDLTAHRFYITSKTMNTTAFNESFKNIKFDFINAVNEKKIKKNKQEKMIFNGKAFKDFSNINNIEKFKKDNPFFIVDEKNKKINLYTGSYQILKNIIIPNDYKLKIWPGTKLVFGPQNSLISYGSIEAIGEKDKSIIFTGKNWGVVGILNVNQENVFKNVEFNGGKDAYINGTYFSGMLSIYHSVAKIENAKFTNAQADDALNIKKSIAKVTNSEFRNNSADAIDFDFIKEGYIANNIFIDNGNDSIDLSGSKITIKDNYIQNSADKCISVGERSIDLIIYNNVLNGCKIGVEVKDSSIAYIINNVIINNKIGINAYNKKAVFGGGEAKIYNSIIWDNKVDLDNDDLSNIIINNSDIKTGNLMGNGNVEIVPEFNKDFTIKNKNDNILSMQGDATILRDRLNIDKKLGKIGLDK